MSEHGTSLPDVGSAPSTSSELSLACASDLPEIAGAVRELLIELGAKPASLEQIQAAAQTVLEDPDAGALILARSDGKLIGFLGVSWQCALRVPGPYGLIQELWVHPVHRSQAVGAQLIDALQELAGERGITRLEVGLPGEGFSHLAATEAFYLNNGFRPNGLRMRRVAQ